MPTRKTYGIIGLMSGTSGDGLDIAYCEFERNQGWNYRIAKAKTAIFPTDLGLKLSKSHLLGAEDLRMLDVGFGKWMGEQVSIFCKAENIKPLAVASHGHTVFHRPDQGNTFQIGNGWSLQESCALPVINDFRMRDVQLGGQGAPLVPIGDMLLFQEYDYCLNLGGIANISFETDGQRKAFDVSPFNLLLNHFSQKLGKPYDEGGQLAKKGNVDNPLLERLNNIPFYTSKNAKSLGREDIEEVFLPLLKAAGLAPKDTLATLNAHFVTQLAEAIPVKDQSRLLVTGGGAYNAYFIECLKEKLAPSIQVVVPDADVVEYKEALIFAFMGALHLRNEPNCLASVTGASRDNIGGVCYGRELLNDLP
ncbi:anhydro-N-acetylmuramic acid kinase [Litoribacter ruber]|uniref:anhydro-N-acetylmuramic acid kinase n=1 Tax=Litoribacter ruber TaxID=702568 RepID=UPI001BD97A6F|nr:anhydro-N-acetylmuramic acid kinase [Litoribacter ruber]MBT0812051.1 anhydro-N-acetylmuramic acid kinase [Litoribacter ruber]